MRGLEELPAVGARKVECWTGCCSGRLEHFPQQGLEVEAWHAVGVYLWVEVDHCLAIVVESSWVQHLVPLGSLEIDRHPVAVAGVLPSFVASLVDR